VKLYSHYHQTLCVGVGVRVFVVNIVGDKYCSNCVRTYNF